MFVLFGSFFMLSNFYRLDLHSEALWYISNSTIMHQPKSDFSLFSYNDQKCMFVDSCSKYRAPPFCSLFECGVVNKLWKPGPNFSEHASLVSSPSLTPNKYRSPIKKIYQITLAYLTWRLTHDYTYQRCAFLKPTHLKPPHIYIV